MGKEVETLNSSLKYTFLTHLVKLITITLLISLKTFFVGNKKQNKDVNKGNGIYTKM